MRRLVSPNLHNGNGNPLASADRKGQAITRTFDALGRLGSVSYADGSTATLILDLAGRPTQVQDSLGGAIARSYDGLDRLTAETTPRGTVSYAYDAAGRRTGMTVPGQAQVAYGYDGADRLTAITQATATASYACGDAGQLIGITCQQGSATVGTFAGFEANGTENLCKGRLVGPAAVPPSPGWAGLPCRPNVLKVCCWPCHAALDSGSVLDGAIAGKRPLRMHGQSGPRTHRLDDLPRPRLPAPDQPFDLAALSLPLPELINLQASCRKMPEPSASCTKQVSPACATDGVEKA